VTRRGYSRIAFLAAAAIALGQAPQATAQADEQAKAAELAKKLSNPVADLISFPVQMNFDYGQAEGSGYKFLTNIQPVVPFSVASDWNVISRTILPVAYQSHVAGDTRQGGLGDTLQSLFLSPKRPSSGGIIWGVGPALLLPTATNDNLGGEKWAAGPTFVVLTQRSGWTIGLLANQLWSFAGSADRSEVNALFVQPILNYTTKSQTTFGLNSETSHNWKAEKDSWSVPINFTVAQLMRFGKLPIQVTGGLRYWAVSPSNGPSGFGFRFAITLLFPKG